MDLVPKEKPVKAQNKNPVTKKEAEKLGYTVTPKSENSILPHSCFSNGERLSALKNLLEVLKTVSTLKKRGVTGVTRVTAANDVACSGYTLENEGVTGVTVKAFDINDAINPLHETVEKIEKVSFSDLDTPCFIVKEDWFELDGVKRKSGVWYCYVKEGTEKNPPANIALRICSPLYVDATTNTECGKFYGRYLRFRDTLGHWRKWAMPMELLRGSCEELRGELLAAGVEIDQQNRAKLPVYLQWQIPKKVMLAATRTGWTKNGNAYVFHDQVIGDENTFFQSESINSDGAAKTGGDYSHWQAIAKLCEGNPVLMLSLCVSFSGALLAKVHRDSGGVHWVGDSSIGKTTALIIGTSVWGGEDFKRTWRATSNGLEGVAALLSDSCMCLDEISEADPREVGSIVYSLGNGLGKTRANRIGSARAANRWRLSLLSTGERSIGAAMQEGGKQAKAGQLIRLLNISAVRKHGVFDDLHHFSDGREMADYFKTHCAKHYGHAGIAFVEHLLKYQHEDFGEVLAKIETQFLNNDSQAARAASRFAVYAMAGELAIEAGILHWKQNSALEACQIMFDEWNTMRGGNATEHGQILQNVQDYILKFGDTKFTDKLNRDEKPRADRSGWFHHTGKGTVYMFTSAALEEAGGGYDFKRVLDALDSAGWIAEYGEDGKTSKATKIDGSTKRLYWILPLND